MAGVVVFDHLLLEDATFDYKILIYIFRCSTNFGVCSLFCCWMILKKNWVFFFFFDLYFLVRGHTWQFSRLVWFCTWGSLLIGFVVGVGDGPYGVLGDRMQVAVCKASTLSSVLSLWLQIWVFKDNIKANVWDYPSVAWALQVSIHWYLVLNIERGRPHVSQVP